MVPIGGQMMVLHVFLSFLLVIAQVRMYLVGIYIREVHNGARGTTLLILVGLR